MFKKYVKYWSKLKKLKTRMFINFSSEINYGCGYISCQDDESLVNTTNHLVEGQSIG